VALGAAPIRQRFETAVLLRERLRGIYRLLCDGGRPVDPRRLFRGLLYGDVGDDLPRGDLEGR